MAEMDVGDPELNLDNYYLYKPWAQGLLAWTCGNTHARERGAVTVYTPCITTSINSTEEVVVRIEGEQVIEDIDLGRHILCDGRIYVGLHVGWAVMTGILIVFVALEDQNGDIVEESLWTAEEIDAAIENIRQTASELLLERWATIWVHGVSTCRHPDLEQSRLAIWQPVVRAIKKRETNV